MNTLHSALLYRSLLMVAMVIALIITVAALKAMNRLAARIAPRLRAFLDERRVELRDPRLHH